MISQNQIVRLAEAQEHLQLLNRVLSNGRCRSGAVRRVLCRPGIVAPASLGLALQRLSEITYRPTTEADRLSRQLIACQRSDGFFGSHEHATTEEVLAATAAAVRGLMTTAAQRRAAGMEVNRSISESIERGLRALAHQYSQGVEPQTEAVGWALVLWHLGDVAEFRRDICVSDLLAMLDESAADLLEDELARYAHAMAA